MLRFVCKSLEYARGNQLLTLKGAALALAAATMIATGLSLARAENSGACGRGWVFFDLGNTLINTSDWDHLKYMPGGRAYVQSLRAAGFHLALISNVPDTWGPTVEAKLANMKNVISQSWSEPTAFEWDPFETILLPPTDQDREPAPYVKARGLASQCKIAYEGEDPEEVRAATAAGFDLGYVVGKTTPGEFYLPADKIFQSP